MPVKRTLKTSGFTIMETLIVLAVAGLILLLVMKAIPALERNSRNDQRKQGVQTVLQSISNWELNNSGTVPDQGTLQNFLNKYDQNKLGYYEPGDVEVPTGAAPQYDVPTRPTDNDHLLVTNYAKCSPDNDKATSTGAGYSDVVALYVIETGGGTAVRCQQL